MAAKKTKKKATKAKATKKAKKTAKAKKPAAKKAKASKPAARKMKTRKPNAAFMKPMTLSATLGSVIGTNPIPRTEVTKKLWAYIKKNNLQDQTEKRYINADEKLRAVFGGRDRVSMFEMTKLVSKHLS